MIWFRTKKPQALSAEQLKAITRVLVVDDEDPKELRDLLRKDGWKHSYLNDLDSLSNKRLEESNVICIDIMGVGKKLQVNNGLELVRHIKERYPDKKIILYSSVSKQDIFSDALDYVDKRLRKESSLVPFVLAIEEMAANTFSWDETIRFTYSKIQAALGGKIDYDEFKSLAEKSITGRGWDQKKFMRKAGVGLDVASKVASLISLAVAGK